MPKLITSLFARTPKVDPEAEKVLLQSQLAMNLRMQRVMATTTAPTP